MTMTNDELRAEIKRQRELAVGYRSEMNTPECLCDYCGYHRMKAERRERQSDRLDAAIQAAVDRKLKSTVIVKGKE